MLGLCWKPATIQGMQKVANSMPSNPEQLLGAILVRRDIFQRFESTMQDTCLDANNLLEYLFSLYNSTATPAERENFQSNQNIRPQAFNAVRRDNNQGKKSAQIQHPGNALRQVGLKGHHMPNIGGQVQGQVPEVHINDGHGRKRVKTDQNVANTVVGHNNITHQNHPQQQGFQNLLRPFDTNPVFPASASNNIKMEMGPDGESRLTQSSSPLPPFSQIRRQQGRPFSPGSAQNVTPGTPSDNSGRKYSLDGSLDPNMSAETSIEQSDTSINKSQSTPLKDSNSGLPRRKRPKRHQCFCGALFTRADNLKRHIRKSHEEKLEKLASTNASGEGGGEQPAANTGFEEFQQLYPAVSQDMQQQQPQQMTQDQDHHHQQQQQQQQPPQQQPQQQQQQVQQQQVQQQQPPPPQEEHNMNDVTELTMNKSAPTAGLKWSCFCGESFEDHRQLVEHSRIHEANP